MRKKLLFVVVLTIILLGSALPQMSFAQSEGTSIQLIATTFDPLAGTPEMQGALPENTGNTMYILQFTGPVLDEWKDAAINEGATLYGYVPDHAFIAQMDAATVAKVRGLSFVRWIGPYAPAYRLEPSLLQTEKSGATSPVTVSITTLPDADLDELGKAIAGWGGTVMGSASNNFGGYLRATLPSDQLGEVAALNGVVWAEPYTAPQVQNSVGGGTIMRANEVRQSLGLFGANQIVAVADTGLDTGVISTVHPDVRGRVIKGYCLGRPSPCNWGDPHGHGTHVAGSVLGNGVQSGSNPTNHQYNGSEAGTAPEARLVFQSIMDANGGLGGIPDDDGQLMRQTYADGARIHTNSWGSNVDGQYTASSQFVDQAAWELKDMLILFSAGNDGTDANGDGVVDQDSMGAPATAKNVLTVGASENNRPDRTETWGAWWPNDFPASPVSGDRMANNANGMAAFSSRGPTDDGRFKPDIAAPGSFILSLLSSQADPNGGWGTHNSSYYYMGGTSMATPLTAGAGALVREWLTRIQSIATPSSALMKAVMLNGAVNMAPGQYGTGATQEIPNSRPNNVSGWGRVDLVNSLTPAAPRKVWLTDNTTGLATGGTMEYQVTITAPTTGGAQPNEAQPEPTFTGQVEGAGLGTTAEAVSAEAAVSPQATVQLVQNGGMESTANWQLSGTNYTTAQAQAGTRSMGTTAGQDGYFYQTLSIPAGMTGGTLIYSWKNIDPDVSWSIYDGVTMEIWDSTGTNRLCWNTEEHGDSAGVWKTETLDLSPCNADLSGKTVRLQFTFDQDSITPHSTFYVDSVSLTIDNTPPTPPDHNVARFTLAWTDYPGQPAAARALVNNLNLEVIAPNGTSYKGNQGAYPAGHACLDNGWDRCNNVEGIIIPNAAAGTYRVIVRGISVPQGTRQPFALVGTGNNMTAVSTAQPNITLNPTSLPFGNQHVNTTSTAKTVTLTNSGNATLNITSIVASGDFQQTNNCGTSRAAGASCTISVTFRPTVAGNRTGAVTINSNAPGGARTIALSGTGTTTTPTNRPPTDFNGDGKADILWRNAATNQNYLFLMNGFTRVEHRAIGNMADATWQVAGVADFNGDSKADILWRHPTTGKTYLFLMNGFTRVQHREIGTMSDKTWKIVGVADFNGDRKADILWRHPTTGKVYLFLMDGFTRVEHREIGSMADPAWRIAGIADFNGDGKADILWRHPTTGKNYLFLMNGFTRVEHREIGTMSDKTWKIVGAADFNGDGKADILWRHPTTGKNYLFLMNGFTRVEHREIGTMSDAAWKIAGLADFDGNGKADILWRHPTTGKVYLFLMNGFTRVEHREIGSMADTRYNIAGFSLSSDYTGVVGTFATDEVLSAGENAQVSEEAMVTAEMVVVSEEIALAEQVDTSAELMDTEMLTAIHETPTTDVLEVSPDADPSEAVVPDESGPVDGDENQEPTSITLTRFESQTTRGSGLVVTVLALAGLLGLGLVLHRRK